jgi:hypothetical protein
LCVIAIRNRCSRRDGEPGHLVQYLVTFICHIIPVCSRAASDIMV